MPDGVAIHGENARIQLDTTVLVGANAWSYTETQDVVETSVFEDDWKRNAPGKRSWSVSLTMFQYQDKRTVLDAIDGAQHALWIYPDFADPTNYHYGAVIPTSSNGTGGVDAAVGVTVDFVGAYNLLHSGFA